MTTLLLIFLYFTGMAAMAVIGWMGFRELRSRFKALDREAEAGARFKRLESETLELRVWKGEVQDRFASLEMRIAEAETRFRELTPHSPMVGANPFANMEARARREREGNGRAVVNNQEVRATPL